LKLINNVIGLFDDLICLFYPKYCEVCKELLFKHEEGVCLYCGWGFPWNISDKELERLLEGSEKLEEITDESYLSKIEKFSFL